MSEQEQRRHLPFELLYATQEDLARRGYYFLPVEREHTEGVITQPLVQRLRTHIKKRGFAKVAGHALITFTGYEHDPHEVYEVPEIRAYYRQLDAEVAELPALVAHLPELRFNGPGLYLMLLGEVDERVDHPALGFFDVHVKDAAPLIQQALRRILQASRKYALSANETTRLTGAFIAGATLRLGA